MVVGALALTACGSDEDGGGGSVGEAAPAETLTIYSSLPLQGAARAQSGAVNGAELALEQTGSKAGKFTVKYD